MTNTCWPIWNKPQAQLVILIGEMEGQVMQEVMSKKIFFFFYCFFFFFLFYFYFTFYFLIDPITGKFFFLFFFFFFKKLFLVLNLLPTANSSAPLDTTIMHQIMDNSFCRGTHLNSSFMHNLFCVLQIPFFLVMEFLLQEKLQEFIGGILILLMLLK